MISITLPDGTVKEYKKGVSGAEIAQSIGKVLARDAIAVKVNEELYDLSRPISGDSKIKILTFESDEGKQVYWHSTAHILAQAVLSIWPEVKLTIGPAIENGFYYDFYKKEPFTPEELERIERKMQEIIDKDYLIKRKEISKSEAKKIYSKNNFKLELLDDFEDKTVTVYFQGDFSDLCRGPHVTSTGKIKAFKLLKVSGAYWRGDQSKESLQRIYGISFPDEKLLKGYIALQEEAEKRDHRKIGRELDLFLFSDLVGSGLPLWTPKGTVLRILLDDFVWQLRKERGYVKVTIPHLTKKELYMTSGHWQKYADDLFKIKTRDGHEFAMKPMNCPHHTQIYAHLQRSYRDLPQRYAETTMVYRDEQTGELSGLSRVLCITQDDAHVFCRESQVQEEAFKIWDIINTFYGTFGFALQIRLSLHDPQKMENYIGTSKQWESAEKQLMSFVKERKVKVTEAIGEAAFYGPKVDFIAEDSLGRKWQVATIQIDRNMPERFDLFCINEKGDKERIVMLHAAIMGSIERFLSVLIEHYAGKFPLWLNPNQIAILPIADRHLDYCNKVADRMKTSGLRVLVDENAETTNKKIREAQLQRFNFILIVGDKEVGNGTVNVRTREGEEKGEMKVPEFIKQLLEEVKEKK